MIASGGSGDLLSALAIRSYELKGMPAILASAVWERPLLDPTPGPRSVNDIESLANDCIGLRFKEATNLKRGHTPLGMLSTMIDTPIYFIDLSDVVGLRSQISRIVRRGRVRRLTLVDTGGDILARRPSEDLVSPTMEALLLSACRSIPHVRSEVAVVGVGLDGEIDYPELRAIMSDLVPVKSYKLPSALASGLYYRLNWFPSEASLMALLSAMGVTGLATVSSRAPPRRLGNAAGTVYRYDLDTVAALSGPSRAVRGAITLSQACDALKTHGYVNEYLNDLVTSHHPPTWRTDREYRRERWRELLQTPGDYLTRRAIARALGIRTLSKLSTLDRALYREVGDAYRRPLVPVHTVRHGRLAEVLRNRVDAGEYGSSGPNRSIVEGRR